MDNSHSLDVSNPEYSKREEFRKYLEKAGVLDALTKGKQPGLTLRVVAVATSTIFIHCNL